MVDGKVFHNQTGPLFFAVQDSAISRDEYTRLMDQPGNVCLVLNGDIVRVCNKDEPKPVITAPKPVIERPPVEPKPPSPEPEPEKPKEQIPPVPIIRRPAEEIRRQHAALPVVVPRSESALKRLVSLLELIEQNKDDPQFIQRLEDKFDRSSDVIPIHLTVSTGDVVPCKLYPLADIDPFNFMPKDTEGFGFHLGLAIISYEIDGKQYKEIAIAILQNDSNSRDKHTDSTIDLTSKFARPDGFKVKYTPEGLVATKKKAKYGIIGEEEYSNKLLELLQRSFHVITITDYQDRFFTTYANHRKELAKFIGKDKISGFAKLAANRREMKKAEAYNTTIKRHHFLVPSMFDAYNLAHDNPVSLKDSHGEPKNGVYLAGHVQLLHGDASGDRSYNRAMAFTPHAAKEFGYNMMGDWMKVVEKGILTYNSNHFFRSGLSSHLKKLRHQGGNVLFGKGGHTAAGGDAKSPIISMVTSDAYEHQLAEKLHKTLGSGDHIDKLTQSVNDIAGGTQDRPTVAQSAPVVKSPFPHYEDSDTSSESGYSTADDFSDDDSTITEITPPTTKRRSASQSVQTEEKKSEKTTQTVEPEPEPEPEPERPRTPEPEPEPERPLTPEPEPEPEQDDASSVSSETNTEDDDTSEKDDESTTDETEQHEIPERPSSATSTYSDSSTAHDTSRFYKMKEKATPRMFSEPHEAERQRLLALNDNFNSFDIFKRAILEEGKTDLIPNEYTHSKPYASLVGKFINQDTLTLSQRLAYNKFITRYRYYALSKDALVPIQLQQAYTMLANEVKQRRERYEKMVQHGKDFISACDAKIASSKQLLATKKRTDAKRIASKQKQTLDTIKELENRIAALEQVRNFVKDLQNKKLICWDPENIKFQLPTNFSSFNAQGIKQIHDKIKEYLERYLRILHRDLLVTSEYGVIRTHDRKFKYNSKTYAQTKKAQLDKVMDFPRYLLLSNADKQNKRQRIADTRYLMCNPEENNGKQNDSNNVIGNREKIRKLGR